VLVNWRKLWRTCPGTVFGNDGTHQSPVGAKCYARLIGSASAI
jgi:hypothetical protein